MFVLGVGILLLNMDFFHMNDIIVPDVIYGMIGGIENGRE